MFVYGRKVSNSGFFLELSPKKSHPPSLRVSVCIIYLLLSRFYLLFILMDKLFTSNSVVAVNVLPPADTTGNCSIGNINEI